MGNRKFSKKAGAIFVNIPKTLLTTGGVVNVLDNNKSKPDLPKDSHDGGRLMHTCDDGNDCRACAGGPEVSDSSADQSHMRYETGSDVNEEPMLANGAPNSGVYNAEDASDTAGKECDCSVCKFEEIESCAEHSAGESEGEEDMDLHDPVRDQPWTLPENDAEDSEAELVAAHADQPENDDPVHNLNERVYDLHDSLPGPREALQEACGINHRDPTLLTTETVLHNTRRERDSAINQLNLTNNWAQQLLHHIKLITTERDTLTAQLRARYELERREREKIYSENEQTTTLLRQKLDAEYALNKDYNFANNDLMDDNLIMEHEMIRLRNALHAHLYGQTNVDLRATIAQLEGEVKTSNMKERAALVDNMFVKSKLATEVKRYDQMARRHKKQLTRIKRQFGKVVGRIDLGNEFEDAFMRDGDEAKKASTSKTAAASKKATASKDVST